MTLQVFDLFSGIGGFSYGLESVENNAFKTIGFCEIDEDARKVLKKHWNNVPIFEDVRKLSFNENQRIDVLCGGFPCTDISVAKQNRQGIVLGNQSGLWFEFKRLIDEAKPKYTIIENVLGILSKGLETVLQDLAKIGYDVVWTTIDSQWTGVAQRRRRVYIIAVRDGIARDSDIFRFKKRSDESLSGKLQNIKESRQWNFSKGKEIRETFAYFTRIRSDQFSNGTVASTLAKRDYKSFTDLVINKGIPRKLTPKDRLILQGMPVDWFDGLDISFTKQYFLSGMTAPAVKWVGDCLNEYDKNYSFSS